MSRPKFLFGHIVSGTSNHATYDVYPYSPKAVKTLMYLKFYEYSTLYLIQNILPFVLFKRFEASIEYIMSSKECVDVSIFIGREITTVLKIAVDNVILELSDACVYFARPLLA